MTTPEKTGRNNLIYKDAGVDIDAGEELVARGQQQVACLRRDGEKLAPTPVPKSLREALAPYGAK